MRSRLRDARLRLCLPERRLIRLRSQPLRAAAHPRNRTLSFYLLCKHGYKRARAARRFSVGSLWNSRKAVENFAKTGKNLPRISRITRIGWKTSQRTVQSQQFFQNKDAALSCVSLDLIFI